MYLDAEGNGIINTRDAIDTTVYYGMTTRGGKRAYK
jgi:hypothetical protein